MTAEERVKVRDWARRNLGKEVTIIDTKVLVSFTNCAGWGPYGLDSADGLDSTDHVLVHSPLNVSFWMVNLCGIDGYAEQE